MCPTDLSPPFGPIPRDCTTKKECEEDLSVLSFSSSSSSAPAAVIQRDLWPSSRGGGGRE